MRHEGAADSGPTYFFIPELVPAAVDPFTARLLVGVDVQQRHLERGGFFIPLKEYLNTYDKSRDPRPMDFLEPWQGMGRSGLVEYGRWLLHFLQQDDPEAVICTQHINAMASLGAGPQSALIRRLFVSFHRYRYAVEASAGRAPRVNKPGPTFYRQRILKRHDWDLWKAWQTQFTEWEEVDYLNWGVRVLWANGGALDDINAAVDHINTAGYGPSASVILDHFSSLADFEQSIEGHFIYYCKQVQQHMEITEKLITKGELPPTLRQMPEWDRLVYSARYRVLKQLGSLIPSERHDLFLLLEGGREFVKRVVSGTNRRVSVERINAIILSRGLYDFIYTSGYDNLVVPASGAAEGD